VYISRLSFYTVPGKTGEVEQALQQLREMVVAAGGAQPRILRTHYASLGAPDVVFEQEAPDLAALEGQIAQVTDTSAFRSWSQQLSELLLQSPKREVYTLL
jgi:hypothetical protein